MEGQLYAMIIKIIIFSFVWGGISLWIGTRKGYNGFKGVLFFLAGFLFGILGTIVACFIPKRRVQSEEFMENFKRNPLFRDEWEKEDKIKEEAFVNNNGGWTCSYCGAKNYGYVGTCSCGRTKQETAS